MILAVGPHIRDRSENSTRGENFSKNKHHITGRDGSVSWEMGNRDCKWKWLFVSGFECTVTGYMIWIYVLLECAEK
jgi:hypothetical protein